MRVVLVFPPPDGDQVMLRGIYSPYLPPSNLAILASAVHRSHPDCCVSILDGNLLSLHDIEARLAADVVGITDWSVCQHNAIHLAARAKELNPNCTVVVGGPNATHLGDRILRNHPAVDLIVLGDGEEALPEIVSGNPYSSIPNLCYRQDIGIVRNPQRDARLVDVPVFDFADLEPSFDTSRVPVPLSGIRGCICAARRGVCSYCSLPNSRVRVAPPELVWSQVASLHKRYGVTYFFETGDDFIVGRYPERLLEARPSSLSHTQWRIYSYPEALNEKTMCTLARLNVRTTFIGVETVTRRALRDAGRSGYGADDIEDLVRRSRRWGIRLIASFVFGLPWENESTTEANCRFLEYLVDRYTEVFEAVSMSIATPVAGSAYFREVEGDLRIRMEYQRLTGDTLETADVFDYGLLTKLFVQNRTGLAYDWLVQQVEHTRNYLKQRGVRSSTFMDIQHREAEVATLETAACFDCPC